MLGAPSEHLVGEQTAAHVMGVVGVAVVGRVHGDDSLEGGRWAATWRPLNPPQDLPIIPTAPLHHGWEAIQAMASTASSCSWTVYSSVSTPCGVPGPRM